MIVDLHDRTKTLKEADLKDILNELMLRFHVESVSIDEGNFIYYDGTRDYLIRIEHGYYAETNKEENKDDSTES